MNKILSIVLLPALFLSACSNGGQNSQDLTDIPTMEITATHAIAIDESADGIGFVPNNVAPWLGRIILQNSDGGLVSTDIEGRSAQTITERGSGSTFGLARENASGVFLAINSRNKRLDAFIESDDQGNFASQSYSGDNISPQTLCTTDNAQQDSASALTADDKIT